MPSEIIESYVMGFEDSFGSHESVLISVKPSEMSLKMEKGDTILDSEIEISI